MSALGWLIMLALPLYAVLQLALVVVLGRYFEMSDDRVAVSSSSGWYQVDVSDGGGSSAAASRSPGECHLCGATNDPTYTYCQNCITRLSRA